MPRVAALLGLLRPVVTELVVALDDRADEETERAAAGIADDVVRFTYREPVDRPLRWLHSRCRGDWILTLDDDEIPHRSPRLLAHQNLPDEHEEEPGGAGADDRSREQDRRILRS